MANVEIRVQYQRLREIIGQIPRLMVGGIKSFVGKIPVGNTGGAYIPPLRPLPIPPDIEDMFTKSNIKFKSRKWNPR